MGALSAALLPLLAAALVLAPASRALGLRLAPWLPLPALALALAAPDGTALDLPWLLLGSRLGLDATGRLFLFFTALVWLIAGVYARGWLRDDPRRHVYWAFHLATQAGNLWVCLAQDAAGFYLGFTLMTFAAYGLVVHTGSAEARRAGRVYLAMAVLGEAALVAGLLLAVGAAGSPLIGDLAAAPLPGWAAALLILGFGIKVGVPLLHLWLPLAHPVAPVPASAVLSGVMLKAGLLGWLRFLPLGVEAQPAAGALLMAAGLAALFYGVAVGLAQRDAKVLLAYSSVSQMGFMTLGVGAGLAAPGLWPLLLPAVGLYALHHALAKSALFLGVGVAQARGGRPAVLAGLALPALALAGAPLTSGALAKVEMKVAVAALPGPWSVLLEGLLPLAAAGTALLMARLLWLAARQAGGAARPGLLAPWLAGLAAVAVLPGWLAAEGAWARALGGGAWVAALWPLALAAALAWAALRRRWRAPAVPPGDVLPLLERAWAALRRGCAGLAPPRPALRLPRPAPGTDPEAGLGRWPVAAGLWLLLALLLAALLA